MYTYLFSVPVLSSSERGNLLEFKLEGSTYPSRDYICNYLYGELSNSSIKEYNRIMSCIDTIRNNHPVDMDGKIMLHTQTVWVEGRGNLVMSVRRV